MIRKRSPIGNQLRYQLYNKLWDQMWATLGIRLMGQQWGELRYRLNDKLWEQLFNQIQSQLRYRLREFTFGDMEDGN